MKPELPLGGRLGLVLLLTLSFDLTAVERDARLECCRKGEAPAGESATRERHYAPDRELVTKHLALDVTPDFLARRVRCTATMDFEMVGRPVQEIRLDAIDLRVKSLKTSRALRGYQATGELLIVTLQEPVASGERLNLEVEYEAEPKHGFYFRTPEMGYREGDTHCFTQGEAIMARHWYPCLDTPNQMFTSEITCRLPAGMVAISNGRLVSEKKDPITGLVAYHWKQEQPHANYLITLAAGFFKKLDDKYRKIPLSFHTPASQIDQAATSFENTRDMMEFFEQEIGVPYPWEKYDQVCVNDFVAGGMENTSATTLTDTTLFSAETENLRNSDGLIAHELAHQWFGDLVTCKDWSHLWLNEGFATYYETLYDGHKNGKDALLYEMHGRLRQISTTPNDNEPIVRRTYGHADEMFNYLTYPKGSWVLHMLRTQLGEDLYRQCVRTFLERHRHGNVVTEDFRRIIEELSHRSFDRFFDQWLYHAHHPELEISYQWDELASLATLTVRQTQTPSEKVMLFEFPLPVRFKGKFGGTDRILNVSRKEQDFSFVLPSAPEIVRIDPEVTVLCKTTFPVSGAMINGQLMDSSDTIGRLLAVENLGARRDRESVAKLKQVLNADAFHGVRIEASKSLRSIHSEEARAALLESLAQPDARVRKQVVEDLGAFYSEDCLAAMKTILGKEANPEIIASALESMGAYTEAGLREVLLRFLRMPSFQNEIAVAAIQGMRKQQDPFYIAPLLAHLKDQRTNFTSHGFARGLETLAQLAREEAEKEEVRDFLISQVESRKRTVRLAAIQGLGTLGDRRATGLLETFASAGRQNSDAQTAERALNELRNSRKSSEEIRSLRQEISDLRKAQSEIRKDLDKPGRTSTPAPAGKETKPAHAQPGKIKPGSDPKPASPGLRSPKALSNAYPSLPGYLDTVQRAEASG